MAKRRRKHFETRMEFEECPISDLADMDGYTVYYTVSMTGDKLFGPFQIELRGRQGSTYIKNTSGVSIPLSSIKDAKGFRLWVLVFP